MAFIPAGLPDDPIESSSEDNLVTVVQASAKPPTHMPPTLPPRASKKPKRYHSSHHEVITIDPDPVIILDDDEPNHLPAAVPIDVEEKASLDPAQKISKIRENLWTRHDNDTILGIIQECNISISVGQLKKLLLDNWLSDDIINAWFVTLSRNCQVSILPTYWSAQMTAKGVPGVERWNTTQCLKQQLRKELDYKPVTLIPVNISASHWVLCALYPDIREWVILDSAGEEQKILHSSFYISMRLWLNEKVSSEDASNCGVYVCHYAESLALGRSYGDVTSDRLDRPQISSRRDDILLALVESIPLPELKL